MGVEDTHPFRLADIGHGCADCAAAPDAPKHRRRSVTAVCHQIEADNLAAREDAITAAMDLAHQYRELCGYDPTAVAGFNAIRAALDPNRRRRTT